MNSVHRFLPLILLLVSFASMASSDKTVTFLSEDGLLITADIHAPYKNGEAPMIVLFHQAGWSRGEYTEIAPWVQDAARHIKVPVFITSSRNEANGWAAIFAAMESGNKASFIPATDGRHGSRALWEKYPDSDAYRKAVQVFLERYFPASS